MEEPGEDVRIRDLEARDLPELLALLDQLGHPTPLAELRRRFSRWAELGPRERARVAERAGRIVGFAILHLTPTLHRVTDVARVTAIAVLAEERRTGIGRRLMADAESFARSHGASRIELTSGPGREAAHRFYRALGYRDDALRFALDLDDAGRRPS